MFYSQTFLARKGPLSTVWIAAHLQHRLKKSHYTSTDIPSTVEHIMDAGVPIALRMLGHLLLGVVRIYSKKVDYLFHDCNIVLTGLSKAFASIQITLPEDARQAPFHSITLPETFDLDALNMDDEIDYNRAEDLHLKSQEEITLTDGFPVVMDHYVAISFDEDIMMDSSHTEATQAESIEFLRRPNNDLNLGISSLFPNLEVNDAEPNSQVCHGPNNDLNLEMDEDIISQSPPRNVVGVEVYGPSTQRESPTIRYTGGDSHGLGSIDNSPPQATQAERIELCSGPNNDLNLEMDEDIVPQSPSRNVVGVEDPGPYILRESPTIQRTGGDSHGLGPSDNNPSQAIQSEPIKFLRSPNTDFNGETSLVFTNLGDNDAEASRDLDKTMNGKDHLDPLQQHFRPPTPVASQGGISDAQVCAENNSPPNSVRHESPPIQQPQWRGRKRKQFFDEPIVLTNKFMRGALNNPRDILRKRKDVPSSNLGTWKLNNSRRKENIFDQPMLTGICKDLLDISKSEYVLSRPHLVIFEEDYADARIVTPPDTACDMEIEHRRNFVASPHSTIPAHSVLECGYRSPNRRDGSMTSHKTGSVFVPSLRTNIEFETPDACETETMQTQDSDTCHLRSMDMILDTDTLQHELGNKELWFLEEDNYTPTSRFYFHVIFNLIFL